MTFAQDPSSSIKESNSKYAAILQLQSQGNADPCRIVRIRIEIDRAFDSVQTGNRQAGAYADSLEPIQAIAYLAEECVIQPEFGGAGTLFHKLHHATMVVQFELCDTSLLPK